MLLYDLASALLLGFGHIYLFLLLLGKLKMPVGYILLSTIFITAFLGISITVSGGYSELNMIVLFVYLVLLGSIKKSAKQLHIIYFALMSIVLFTVIKNGLYALSLNLYIESPFNLYVWTQNAIHFYTILIIVIGFYFLRYVIKSVGIFLITSRVYIPSFILIVICSLLLLIVNYPATAILAEMNRQYGEQMYLIILLLAIVFLLFITINVYRSRERLIEKHEQFQHEQLMDYVSKLEFMHDELSTFRHDYTNLLLSLEESIRANDIDQVKQIYETTVAPTATIMNHQQLELTKLSRIQMPELKSVLSMKVLEAQRTQLTVHLDIPHNITTIDVPSDQFIRIISILIDNAFEEARKSQEKTVQIAIFEVDPLTQYFIVKNDIHTSHIDLEQLYSKHYSTKGDHRGYGLFSVKRLVNKHPNMTLTTLVEANKFEQKMIIKSTTLPFTMN